MLSLISYPDDPYDRNWLPWTNPEEWSDISTADKVNDNTGNLALHAPSVVMQTAITSRKDSKSKTIQFSWDIKPNHVYPMPG